MATMGNRGRTRISQGVVTTGESQNFVCDICQAELPNNHKLLSHKRRHNVAEVINYDENSNDGDTSQEIVSQQTGQPSYHCDQCDKILNTAKGLNLHQIKLHNKPRQNGAEAAKKLQAVNDVAILDIKSQKIVSPLVIKMETMEVEIGTLSSDGIDHFSQPQTIVEVGKPETIVLQAESKVANQQPPFGREFCTEETPKLLNDTNTFEESRIGKRNGKSGVEFFCRKCPKVFNTKKGLILHGVKTHNRRRPAVTESSNSEIENEDRAYEQKIRNNVSKPINYSENSNNEGFPMNKQRNRISKKNYYTDKSEDEDLANNKRRRISKPINYSENSNDEDSMEKKRRRISKPVNYSENSNDEDLIEIKRRRTSKPVNYSENSNDEEPSEKFANTMLKRGKFQCDMCPKIVATERGLLIHQKLMHVLKQKVGGVPPVKSMIFEHSEKAEESESFSGDFMCDKCGKLFETEEAVVTHDSKAHNSVNEEEHFEDVDEINSGKRESLEFHKGKNVTDFLCDHCGKYLDSSQGLAFHVALKHKQRKKRTTLPQGERREIYKCSQCIYATKLYMNLQKHERTHIPIELRRKTEKIRYCHLCPYTTYDAGNLSKHLTQTHKQGKPKNCPLCKYQTFSILTFKAHMIKKHNTDLTPSTICPKCGTKFKTLHDLRCHKWKQMGQNKSCGEGRPPSKPKLTSPEKKEEIPIRNYYNPNTRLNPPINFLPQPRSLHMCQVCDKRFATKRFLKKHFKFFHATDSNLERKSELNTIKTDEQSKSPNPDQKSELNTIKKDEPPKPPEEYLNAIKVENQIYIAVKVENAPNGEEKEIIDESLKTQLKVQTNSKLIFPTDKPELQCQFCFVDCWDAVALAKHVKRHR